MSLEVTLIPLALVVINVIDKNYYDSWMKQSRFSVKTNYSSLSEFLEDLNRLNYKYDIKHDTVRICSVEAGKNFYFSKIQGIWNLSFSEYDSKDVVQEFLRTLSKISNGKVPDSIPQKGFLKREAVIKTSGRYNMPALENKKVHIYPTLFKDFSLLCVALNKMGICYSVDGRNIEFQKDRTKCSFMYDGEQYLLRTVGEVSSEAVFHSMCDLDIVYKRNVQLATYESVMSKLAEHKMTLAEEMRLEDETILLTLNVE